MAVQPPKVANIDVDVPIEEFGGLVTELTPADIPMGASPFAQDVDYQLGAVFTRAGLTSQGIISAAHNCNYLRTFTLPNTNDELLSLWSDGSFHVEDTTNLPGVHPVVATLSPNQFANSVTQFGREWLAFNDGSWGLDAPRQWDSTFLDRVSQDGPGTSPTVVDEIATANISAAPAGASQPAAQNVNSASEAGNIVTVVLAASIVAVPGNLLIIAGVGAGYDGTWTVLTANNGTFTYTFAVSTAGLGVLGAGGTAQLGYSNFVFLPALPNVTVGTQVTVAGVTNANYNGTWTVTAVQAPTQLQVSGVPGGQGTSGTGTITIAGNITAGVHKAVQIFLTRQGYLTAPSPITSWTAVGARRAIVTALAIGPANVLARWLAFTSAGGGFFFVIPIPTTGSLTGTVVNDNTSVSFTVDFTDVALLNSFSIDSAGNNLFNLVVLGPSAGVVSYANRMIYWGERNKIQNFLNMGFDGGFDPTDTFPLGWTISATSGGGGAEGAIPSSPNDAYQITSGANPVTPYGQIQQPAFHDQFNVAILKPNTIYSARFMAIHTGVAAGNFVVELFSPTAGSLAIAQVLNANISTAVGAWVNITFNAATPAAIPSDTVLRIYELGDANGNTITIDELEIFPTAVPYISTTLRASYNSNPESFDGVTGRIGISNLDGQAIKACFKLRDNLYVVKEGSLYVTQDNGSTEPFGWTVSTISTAVGTPSIRGIAVAEEYAFIVNQLGVYLFNGSEPVRVNQEIKPVSGLGQGWDSINWKYGANIWVALDINNRHLLIGAPTGVESPLPNQIFMMNYRELDESYAVASQKAVHMSYTGKMVSWDMSRKWAQWSINANCCAIVRRQNLSLEVWFGNNRGTGKAYKLDPANGTDDGAAILSQYWTFFFVNREMEQGLQVGSHRHLYTYGAAFVSGVGVLSLTAVGDSLTSTRTQALAPRALSGNPNYDTEFGVNFSADRTSFKFATDGVAGSTFFLSKMTVTMKADPWAPVRGRV